MQRMSTRRARPTMFLRRGRSAPAPTMAILLLVLAALALLPAPAARAQAAVARPHPDGLHLARPDGRMLFVLGYNYEGPADRAWQMWQRFDAGLIAADLARARGGGANTVRLFVQEPLPDEILAGDFRKLDAVLEEAARQGLLVLLTLYDYGERDLARVAEVNRRIAERYRGSQVILAYDLRNEPQFITLAAAQYPGGPPPLQRADLVAVYGERVGMAAVPAYRTSGDGRVLPEWWDDEQVYAYANNLDYFRELLTESERWVAAAPGRTTIDFLAAPEALRWRPLLEALDATLAAWIETLAGPIRAADPQRMLTVGWSNTALAGLPANGRLLEFVSLHRFPRPGAGSVSLIFDLGAALRRAHPGRPVLFEEIGFSTHEASPESAAALEMAVATRAYAEGYAGFLKWMLTDLPPVGDPREDSFGALWTDGGAKPVFHALGAFGTYLANTAAPPGGFANAWDRADGASYLYQHRDAWYIAGPEASGPLGFRFDAPGQVLLRKRGAIFLLTTRPGEVVLNLRELMPHWTGAGAAVSRRAGAGWEPVSFDRASDTIRFAVQEATPYRIALPRHTDIAPPRAGCRHFPETGHNLCGAFLRYWQANGGLAVFGYPISEEFAELNRQDGNTYTVQYFERNRFEYHPELAGTRYEVLLGLLGNDLTAGRRGEGPFLPVAGPPPGADYFPETGHSLGGAFRAYWQANGGLAVFGYPISEEFVEVNPADGRAYTVQYFERNRFEYHPELAGTRYEVLLGLLGNQVVDGNGWQ
ncbi:MAG TPA: hypothetical protein VNL77_11810 [Roseiflexaceae bacterium]|nr:hypothetical protein [Roseiflexaceae bacterium]